MKINLIVPRDFVKQGWGGVIPLYNLFEHGFKELGHTVSRTQTAKADEINIGMWQCLTDKKILTNPKVLNKTNSALLQVEPLDSWLMSYNQVWLQKFETFMSHDYFFKWSEAMNIWDYSGLNFKYLPEANKTLKFDYGFVESLFKPSFKGDAKGGMFFYGSFSNRRKNMLEQLYKHVDVGFFTRLHGDQLFELVSDYSFALSIGNLPVLNFEMDGVNTVTGHPDQLHFRHDRKIESLRMVECLHRGFFTLCELGDDQTQNEYWADFCVLSPLLNLLPNSIDLLTDNKFCDVQQEKVANFKERTSMASICEKLLDETF